MTKTNKFKKILSIIVLLVSSYTLSACLFRDYLTYEFEVDKNSYENIYIVKKDIEIFSWTFTGYANTATFYIDDYLIDSFDATKNTDDFTFVIESCILVEGTKIKIAYSGSNAEFTKELLLLKR